MEQSLFNLLLPDSQLLPYLAGFMDGEGCISISEPRGTSFYLLNIQICNTNKAVLEIYKHRFAGKINGPYKRGPNCKPFWNYRADAQIAERIIKALSPYLIVKKRQAVIALEFRELFKGDFILPRGNKREHLERKKNKEKKTRILAMRRDCMLRIKTLNRRGA